MKRSARERRLLSRLKALAWSALAAAGDDPKPCAVRASDGVVSARLALEPADAREAPRVEDELCGSFLSPVESAIVLALGSGPLAGKALARVTAQKYTPAFRTILHNLRARGVLGHTESGYVVNRRKRGRPEKL